METVIVFAGKTGTTKRCATFLRSKLPFSDFVDLNIKTADISAYDMIIIGASVRMGMIHNRVKSFIEENAETLKSKKVAFFICNGSPDAADEIFQKNIPAELLEKAVCAMSFGGEIDIGLQKGADKIIAKLAMKSSRKNGAPAPKILHENIEEFALKVSEG